MERGDGPRNIPQPERAKIDPIALAKLLDEWMQADAAEQHETFAVLRDSLDENRPSGYKLFS